MVTTTTTTITAKMETTEEEVPNEAFQGNDEHNSVDIVHHDTVTKQTPSVCNDVSAIEVEALKQTPLNSTSLVANAESSVSDCCILPLNDDVRQCNAKGDSDDASTGTSNVNDLHEQVVHQVEDVVNDIDLQQETLPEVSITALNVAQVTVTEQVQTEEKEKEVIEKDAVNCNVLAQSSETVCSTSSQVASTTRKNKSKKSRGRRRKDSQNTENQSHPEESEHTASQLSKEKSSSQISEEYRTVEGEQNCPPSGTEETYSMNDLDQEKICISQSSECLQNELSYNSTEKENDFQCMEDSQSQCSNEQTRIQCPQEQTTDSVTDEQAPQLLQEESSSTTAEETLQQSINSNLIQTEEKQEVTECTEQQDTQLAEETQTLQQCNEVSDSDQVEIPSQDDQPEGNFEKQNEVQRSFNISVEQTQPDASAGAPENMSPHSRRKVKFQKELEDDEIPDLSDIDGLTEEEQQSIGKKPEGETDREKSQRKGENKIEITSPTGEATHLKPVKPRPNYDSKRMESGGSEEQKDEILGMCANCSNLAKLRCGNCRQAFYCKKECQKEHWKSTHKEQCRPYQVLENSELGRYIVASRDLKAGDVILKEDPIVVGPKQITEPVCLGCYKRIDGSYRCQKCHWPMCGSHCANSPDHQPECVVGMEIGSPIEISNFDEPNHFYEVVFPLRCLALKKKSPKKYEQMISLDSHYEDRKGTHTHVENQKSIVNMLRNYFFLQQFPIEDIDSSEKSIHNITGIIDVNGLEIRLPDSEIVGLYPNFAMMEHSCTPNTKHTFSLNRQVVLKASVDIKRGEHLSTMYTHILWGTLARRDHLKHIKYFMCTCFRCSDPTELGTNFSTLRCKQCANGFMLSAAPLDLMADWLCTTCNATIKYEEVTDTNLKLGEEIENVLSAPAVIVLEDLLQRHGKQTVHPNHFHLFITRHTLLQMYGRDPAFATEEYMKKKERMCQDFLKVCTALDPGMSRLAPYAGVALYEYHLAVLSRTRQDPEARQTDPAALKKDVETAKALLQQCIRVLQDEPKDQPEGQLCHVAQQNLIELRQWEANLFSP